MGQVGWPAYQLHLAGTEAVHTIYFLFHLYNSTSTNTCTRAPASRSSRSGVALAQAFSSCTCTTAIDQVNNWHSVCNLFWVCKNILFSKCFSFRTIMTLMKCILMTMLSISSLITLLTIIAKWSKCRSGNMWWCWCGKMTNVYMRLWWCWWQVYV